MTAVTKVLSGGTRMTSRRRLKLEFSMRPFQPSLIPTTRKVCCPTWSPAPLANRTISDISLGISRHALSTLSSRNRIRRLSSFELSGDLPNRTLTLLCEAGICNPAGVETSGLPSTSTSIGAGDPAGAAAVSRG